MNNSYLYFQTFFVLGKEIMCSQNMFSLGTEKKKKNKKDEKLTQDKLDHMFMFRNQAKSQRYHVTSPGGNARTRSPDIQVLVSTLELTYLAYLNPTCCKASE